jgi:hypothetical protein
LRTEGKKEVKKKEGFKKRVKKTLEKEEIE